MLVQSTSPAGVVNQPVIPDSSIANSFSVTAVQSSDLSPSSTYALTQQQTAAAKTTSTSTLLNAIGVSTTRSYAVPSLNAKVTPSSVSGSVTAQAKTTTAAKAFTLSDYIDLPIQRSTVDSSTLSAGQQSTASMASTVSVTSRGVKSVTPCLNDYYIEHSNGTTAHRLVNICVEKTQIKGHIDPRCSVKPRSNNPLNEFDLKQQGGIYKVTTQNNEICQQPILVNNHPKKIGTCLYFSETTNDDEFKTLNLTVVNGCQGTSVEGFFSKKCKITGKKRALPWDQFTLTNLGDTFTLHADEYCGARDVIEGPPPTADLVHAYLYSQPNANGTISLRLLGRASPSTNGYLKKNCTVDEPSPDNEWNKFKLNADKEIAFLVHDKPACKNPFVFGKAPKMSYVRDYCLTNKPSSEGLPDTPRAAKIVAGEGLLSQDARHLVYLVGQYGSCTGSLISDRHVLTAGHCLYSRNEDDSEWRFGFLNKVRAKHHSYSSNGLLYKPRTEYRVKAAHIAPCYIYEHKTKCDLALLELEKPVINGRSIALPTAEDFCEFAQSVSQVLATDKAFPNGLSERYDKTQQVWQEGNVIVQGFGQQVSKGKLVSSKMAQHGKVVATSIGEDSGFIKCDQSNKKTNICDGDSGGPLIFETKRGKKVQVGVTSRRATDKLCNGASYYVNVYDKVHSEWIKERMEEDSNVVKVTSGDLTRLRSSPDSCVEKTDQADGLLSLLAGPAFPTKSRRKLTFTNNCHNKNHPAEVNIRFYSGEKKKENLKTVAGIETTEQIIRLGVGETRAFHTSGMHIKAALTWSDWD